MVELLDGCDRIGCRFERLGGVVEALELDSVDRERRAVPRVHLLPVVLQDVVGDHAAQAVTHHHDAVVHSAEMQVAQEPDAVTADALAHRDVLRRGAEIACRVPKVPTCESADER